MLEKRERRRTHYIPWSHLSFAVPADEEHPSRSGHAAPLAGRDEADGCLEVGAVELGSRPRTTLGSGSEVRGFRGEPGAVQLAQPGFIRDGTWGVRRAPDRKRRALHQAEIGARAGPIWHYAALRGTTWHKIDPYM